MIVKKTEALTALSLTAAVVRFANAGENLIAIATRLKRDNIASQAEIQQLSKCLEDFRDLSPHRETSQAYDSHLFEDLDCQKAEDFLTQLALYTLRQSGHIHHRLRRVRNAIKGVPEYPKSSSEFNYLSEASQVPILKKYDERVASVRVVFVTLWDSHDFVSDISDIIKYREKLNIALLRILNATTASGHVSRNLESSASRIDTNSKQNEIAEIVAVNLQKGLNLVAALLTRRNGETFSILSETYLRHAKDIVLSGNSIRYNFSAKTTSPTAEDTIANATSDVDGRSYGNSTFFGPAHLGDTIFNAPIHIHEVVKPSQELEEVQVQSPSSVVRKIENALHFHEEGYRVADIKEAHCRTFDWIFSPTTTGADQGFPDWLAGGNGIFWINGKAGSGKSTLMKHLLLNPQTVSHLTEWAGGRELGVIPFFFWHLGTTLQKSYEGIIRSLLLQVLKQRQDLAYTLFPRRYVHCLSTQSNSVRLETQDLAEAVDILTKKLPQDVSLFIMVDGIDEYSGNHREFCKFLVRLTDNPSIKVLASSRPIGACDHVFSSFPSLRLQDLTARDVKNYIEEELIKDNLLQEMNSMNPGFADRVMEELISKASGVFLWINLVIKMLLDGLENYDSPDALLRKIDRLPSDLERLYNHMFDSMPPEYQQEGSTLLQLTKRAIEVQGSEYTALQSSFADSVSSSIIQKPLAAFSSEFGEAQITRIVDRRLRSRCCGLVEVQYKNKGAVMEPRVNFLHRTVVEYLNDNSVWTQVKRLKNLSQNEIDTILLNSCLQHLQNPFTKADSELNGRQARLLRGCYYYSRRLSANDDDSYVESLCAADTILMQSSIWNSHERTKYRFYNDFHFGLFRPTMVRWGVFIEQLPGSEINYPLLFFVAGDLCSFWRYKLFSLAEANRPRLLHRVLAVLAGSDDEFARHHLENLKVLLDSTDTSTPVTDAEILTLVNHKALSWTSSEEKQSMELWRFWLNLQTDGTSLARWNITLLLLERVVGLRSDGQDVQDLREKVTTLKQNQSVDNVEGVALLDNIISVITQNLQHAQSKPSTPVSSRLATSSSASSSKATSSMNRRSIQKGLLKSLKMLDFRS